MNVGVNPACGDDIAFTGDHLGPRTDDDIDTRLHIGVPGLADPGNTTVANADIGLDDAGIIKDQRVGDHGIDRSLGTRCLRLAHAVADDLAATEFDFLAKDREILFDLDQKLGISQPNLITHGRAKHGGIGCAINFISHFYAPSLPLILALKP